MNLETLVIIGILFAIFVICLIALIYTVRLFKMHDVRNADGQLAWMVPSTWIEVQSRLIETQELMAGSLTELTVQNSKITKLLGAHTDATLAMFEELKKLKNK